MVFPPSSSSYFGKKYVLVLVLLESKTVDCKKVNYYNTKGEHHYMYSK